MQRFYKPLHFPATLCLIGASVATWLLMMTPLADVVLRNLLIAQTAYGLTEVQSGQWWRLVTPIFLHFGLFHLVFNMLWTWEFGRMIESQQSAAMLLGLTALLGIAANLAQFVTSGPLFGGMSGVMYGFLGYVWLQGAFNPRFTHQIAPQVLYVLLGWFALCWSGVLSWFNLHVANVAHTAGLLCGIAVGGVVLLGARFGRSR